jgi:hypothetical protein
MIMDLQGLLDVLTRAQNDGTLAALQAASSPAAPADETTEVEQLAAELADHKVHPERLARVLRGLDRRVRALEDPAQDDDTPAGGE